MTFGHAAEATENLIEYSQTSSVASEGIAEAFFLWKILLGKALFLVFGMSTESLLRRLPERNQTEPSELLDFLGNLEVLRAHTGPIQPNQPRSRKDYPLQVSPEKSPGLPGRLIDLRKPDIKFLGYLA